jgi:hypothetical protein
VAVRQHPAAVSAAYSEHPTILKSLYRLIHTYNRYRYKQSMLLFGGVADDDALETSTFFNDVYATVLFAHCFCHDFPPSCGPCDTLCMYVLKLERMQWHQVFPHLERTANL